VRDGTWTAGFNFPEVGTSADAWALVKNERVFGALEAVLGRGNVALPPKGCLKCVQPIKMRYGPKIAAELREKWALDDADAMSVGVEDNVSENRGDVELRIDPTSGDGYTHEKFLERHGSDGELMWQKALPAKLKSVASTMPKPLDKRSAPRLDSDTCQGSKREDDAEQDKSPTPSNEADLAIWRNYWHIDGAGTAKFFDLHSQTSVCVASNMG